jgi:nucleoside-diphosphate-sugar epimerase
MLMHRIIRAGLRGEVIEVYGDGTQSRDFTFVGDVVDANWRAAEKKIHEGVLNIATGRPISVNGILNLFEELSGIQPKIKHVNRQRGDPDRTLGATDAARRILGFEGRSDVREGFRQQLEWQSLHHADSQSGPRTS